MRYRKLSNREACRQMLKKWRALDRHLKAERARGMNNPQPLETNPLNPSDRSYTEYDRLFHQNDVCLPAHGPLKLTWIGLTDPDVDLFNEPPRGVSRGDFSEVEAKTERFRAKPADYSRLKVDDFDEFESDPYLTDDVEGFIRLVDDVPNDFIDDLEAFDELNRLEDDDPGSPDFHQLVRDRITTVRQSA